MSGRVARQAAAELVRAAPRPSGAWIAGPALEDLAELYSSVTGRPLERVTPRQRHLLAVAARIHGARLESLLRCEHLAAGETNLLLRVRLAGRAVDDLLEGLPAASEAPIEAEYPASAWDLGPDVEVPVEVAVEQLSIFGTTAA